MNNRCLFFWKETTVYIPVSSCGFSQGQAKTTRMTFLRQCAQKPVANHRRKQKVPTFLALLSALRCGTKLFRTVLCRDCAALRLGHYDPSSDSTPGSNSEAALYHLLLHVPSITKQRSFKCFSFVHLFCSKRWKKTLLLAEISWRIWDFLLLNQQWAVLPPPEENLSHLRITQCKTVWQNSVPVATLYHGWTVKVWLILFATKCNSVVDQPGKAPTQYQRTSEIRQESYMCLIELDADGLVSSGFCFQYCNKRFVV